MEDFYSPNPLHPFRRINDTDLAFIPKLENTQDSWRQLFGQF